MPPPTWPTSSGLAKDYSGSSPNDEDVRRNPMTSLDEQLIGNMHLSTQQEDDNDPERDWALKEPLASTNEPSSMEGWADPAMPLEAMDWEDLERRYNDAMAERDKIEDGICQEFGSLFEVWMSDLWIACILIFPSSSRSGWKHQLSMITNAQRKGIDYSSHGSLWLTFCLDSKLEYTGYKIVRMIWRRNDSIVSFINCRVRVY
jgi:hypothetical protein